MQGMGATQGGVEKNYGEIRDKIQDGDLLLFKGSGPLSWIITKVSKSPYSHSGIAMWWSVPNCERRLMVFEAVGKGVRCNPASTTVDKYSGQVDWYALTGDARAKVKLGKLFDACVDNLGKKFGVLGLFKYAWRRFFGRLSGHAEDPRPRAMFCSFYVSHCLREADLDPVDKYSDDSTSPGALASSEALEPLVTLHSGE